MLAAERLPARQQLLWIIVAMVSARSAAMAFNRLADASIDAANPRTQTRALPAGTLTPAFVATFVVVSCASVCPGGVAAESPGAAAFSGGAGSSVAVLLHQAFYALVASGAGLGAGHCPVRGLDRGARLFRSPYSSAYRGGHVLGGRLRRALCLPGLRIRPAGGLHSIPRYFGIARALWIARLFHVLMLALLMGLVAAFGLGKLAVVGVIVVALLLAYEHSLVSPNNSPN